MSEPGTFVPFEKMPFADVERVLEDWIQSNPGLLLHDETIVFIGRQVRTQENKILDLLGIDRSGACVVVELKRGPTPRDVIAQVLEYAAWVDGLSLERLDDLANSYARRYGGEFHDVAGAYRQVFIDTEAAENEDGEGEGVVPSQFNEQQRIVIVAEQFTPEVERALRYLRTRHGVDIVGIQFGIHKAGTETLVETEVVIGRERQMAAAQKVRNSERGILWTDDALEEWAGDNGFLRDSVKSLQEWVQQVDNPRLAYQPRAGRDRDVLLDGKTFLHCRYDRSAMACEIYRLTDNEVAQLRSGLTSNKPVTDSRSAGGRPKVQFYLVTHEDLRVVQQIVRERLVVR